VLLATLAGSLSPAHAADPARARSCGWILEPSADRENALFPDTATRYLAAIAPVPPGGYVEITGDFPHARYMSLQTYSSTLQSTSNLRDEVILPDAGSVNPFVPGADRTAAARHYTVRLVAGAPPAGGGPPNTLYDTSPDGSKSGRGLAYRIYLPDRTAGPFGGVAAPKLTTVLSDGTRLGQPQCDDPLTDTGLTQSIGALGWSGFPATAAGGDGLLAYRSPVWHRYVNAPTSYATGVTDNPTLPPGTGTTVTGVTDQLPSGLGENADNKYIYAYLSQEYGQVVALRARMPTTPGTFDGEPLMGSGELRYWSMCTANRTTQSYACVADKDVRTDANGYYTVVVSPASARPANAVPACGVAWLPWGPDPKGIAYERNMLPAADFTHAVQNATPGTEEQALGDYYPRGTYYATPSAFEATGCHGSGA
jgi:hypothetical protein